MKVLVACEYSGTVRDAFAKRGHDAWSCDIIPTEAPGNHIFGDVLNHLDGDWDLMIAHPPCTYLSNAGVGWLLPKGKLNQERYSKGLEGKSFFMKLLNAPIPKICVENPMPTKLFGLPIASQIVNPYEFGDPFAKRTYLWLKNLPPLMATAICGSYESTVTASWYNKGGKSRQKNRAKFWPGIAQAMAEQWG